MLNIRNIDKYFEKLYKALALLAVICVAAPITQSFIFDLIGYSGIFGFVFTALIIALGYFMQDVYGRAAKVKRYNNDSSYEGTVKFYNGKDAAITMSITVVLSIIAFNIAVAYMKYRAEIGLDQYYDPETLFPYLVCVVTVVLLAMGIVIWFYPYSRIISIRTIFAYIALFLISFITMRGFVKPILITFCLMIFVICTFLILNQCYIITIIKRSKTGVVTPEVRYNNIIYVLAAAASSIGVIIVIAATLVGVIAIARMLMYFILSAVFRNEDNAYGDASELAESFSEEVFNMSSIGLGNQQMSGGLFAIFTILIVGVVVYVTLLRHSGIFKKIVEFFNSLIDNIIAFLSNSRYFNRVSDDYYDLASYKDENIKMDKNVSSKSKHINISDSFTYRDFIHHLNSLKTNNEKMQYSYQVLVSGWKGKNYSDYSLRSSDTPREIKEKVLYRTSIERSELENITAGFEKYKYALDEISDDESEKILNSVCFLIEKNYN